MRSALFFILISFYSSSVNSENLSLVVDDVPVGQVLHSLATSQQINVVVAQGAEQRISLHLVDVPWRQALDIVLETAGLEGEMQGNVLRVSSRAWLQQQQQARQLNKESEQARQPLESATITVHHADVAELATALGASGTQVLTPAGSLVVDKRTSRIILRDTRQALMQARQLIETMDLPLGQVELAAHIVTMNQHSLRELGVKWQNMAEGSKGQWFASSELGVSEASTTIGFNIGRIDSTRLALELSALEQQQQLDIIASPRLITSHQQPASIKQGSEIPYQTASGDNQSPSVEFKEAVLGMDVTPTVLPQGRVRLALRISQNTPGQVLQRSEGEVLAIDKQEIESHIDVRSGETVVLGGIFQQKQREGENRVPVLGAIPWLGGLFRYQGKEAERRELVVFITTRLVEI